MGEWEGEEGGGGVPPCLPRLLPSLPWVTTTACCLTALPLPHHSGSDFSYRSPLPPPLFSMPLCLSAILSSLDPAVLSPRSLFCLLSPPPGLPHKTALCLTMNRCLPAAAGYTAYMPVLPAGYISGSHLTHMPLPLSPSAFLLLLLSLTLSPLWVTHLSDCLFCLLLGARRRTREIAHSARASR